MAEEQATEVKEKKVPFCDVQGDEGSVLSFLFKDGSKVECDLEELNDDMTSALIVHGLTQKVRDSFAAAKGDVGAAVGSATKVWENLKSGQWNASRASGTEGAPRTNELAQAIADIKGHDLAAVQKAVDDAPDEKRKAWRKNPAVKARIMEIRAEKAKAALEKSKGAGESIEIEGL